MSRLPFLPLTAALFVLGELTFLICFAVAAIWSPAIDMRGLFRTILPGFGGFDVGGLLIGAVWIGVYAVYAGAVSSVTWNLVAGRMKESRP